MPLVRLQGHQEIGGIWKHIRHLVTQALETGDENINERDLVDSLIEGKLDLWVGAIDQKPVAICTTAIIQYPRYKAVMIENIAAEEGHLDSVMEWLEELLGWARAQGCVSAIGFGRLGWKKFVPGWRADRLVFSRSL